MAATPIVSGKTGGRDFVRVSPAGVDWEEFEFPPWVRQAYIRTFSGTGYVSDTALGAFNAADTNYNTLRISDTYLHERQPADDNQPPIRTIRMAHNEGSSGVFQIEMLG